MADEHVNCTCLAPVTGHAVQVQGSAAAGAVSGALGLPGAPLCWPADAGRARAVCGLAAVLLRCREPPPRQRRHQLGYSLKQHSNTYINDLYDPHRSDAGASTCNAAQSFRICGEGRQCTALYDVSCSQEGKLQCALMSLAA